MAIYNDIKSETGVAQDIVWKFEMRKIELVECEDIHKVLTCVEDLNRSGQISSFADGTKWSKTIQNAIRENSKMKPHKAVID